MILNKKLKTLLVLALYIGFTIAIYAIVCHFIDKPFQEIHLLYRMHCLFTGLYCGEKEEVSSFIVFPSTGCTNPGAISASGFMTKSRSAINGWGRINFAPEGEVVESIKSS